MIFSVVEDMQLSLLDSTVLMQKKSKIPCLLANIIFV